MPPNVRNRKFTFGFLNNNQNETNLKKIEAAEAQGLDIDNLALGTLDFNNYGITNLETGKDFTAVTVNGTDFQIDSGDELVEYKDSTATFREFADAITPGPATTASILNLEGNNAISLSQVGSGGTINGTTVSKDTGTAYSGATPNTYLITVTADNGASITYSVTVTDPSGVKVTNTNQVATEGVNILVSSDPNPSATDRDLLIFNFPVGVYTPGDTLTVDLTVNALSDGIYSYSWRPLWETAAQNGQFPQGVLGTSDTVEVTNFSETGARQSSNTPSITVPLFGPSLPSPTTLELYRQDETSQEFIKITQFTSAQRAGAPFEFVDTVSLTSLTDFKIADKDDESDTVFNTAIGTPAKTYVKLYSFDNSLWRVPKDRQDLIVFSKPGEFWSWQRLNSFSFDGTVIDVVSIRDPTTVGGSLTKVVFTTDGIYNITGSGVEADPYVLVKIINDISVETNSIIDANGILMFMSKSTDGGYDTGSYGQKVYEYDLQRLVEISARIKNSDFITSTAAVQFSELRGSDKYLVKKTGVAKFGIYHRDAQGWVENLFGSTAWLWTSKRFTPEIMQRFRLEYARFLKIDVENFGVASENITIQLITFTGDAAEGTTATTFIFSISATNRQEFIQRMPNVKGRGWEFKVTANNNVKLYNLWFVD